MSSDLPAGTAILVAGHGADERAVRTLGSIGEALLATDARWRVDRQAPGAGERHAPTRANVKRLLDSLAGGAGGGVVLFACSGEIIGDAEPALVTGPNPAVYPDEDALPLRWIADRLRGAGASQLVAVIAGRATGGSAAAARWLDALRTDGDRDLIAVDGGSGLDALLAGLCGAALDPRTGTITLRSLGTHLVRAIPSVAIQPSTASETVASPPPLGLLFDARAAARSQSLTRTRPAPAEAPAAAAVDLVGVVLPGRFRVDAELARGSFGVVYRARQLSVDRDVAVKIMHEGIDPASDDGRLFVQEIQAVGRIEHPNVVRIYQADVTPDGRLFFAMELLGGMDLRKVCAAVGALAVPRAVGLVRQLLAGLGAAHEAGLIHADVKPANAILVDTGRRRATGEQHGDDPAAGDRVVLVDFGLARLRPTDGPVEALGGTPAYMAPEQLRGERIDARADLFSAALVLVSLLTGWQRPGAEQLVPPLDDIADPIVRAALARALAIDPADRFHSAADFADALVGRAPRGDPTQLSRAPFRHLAAFTERDVGRFHGRDRELATLVEHALYRRATIYTAPSGTGKTSLLRAGLVPRLATLGARAVYFSCRAGGRAALAQAIAPGVPSVRDAIAARADAGRRLVVVLDQVEAALEVGDGDGALVGDVLAACGDDARASVILSVREDFLARLVAVRDHADEALPIVRLGPMSPEGARAAISLSLAEVRLTIAPDLLDALLVDLERAAATVGAELGWGRDRAVYPPHLQLAGAALYEALGRGETELSLAHYRKLGGLDAIVGEHLDRVLDRELDEPSAKIARDVFLALVTAGHSRAVRGEAELLDAVGGADGKDRVVDVLEALRARGLMVRVRAASGEPAWELVHDSLVPRILAWVDRRDLARRRAIELVRYHLRRSQPARPSLLSRGELREVRPHLPAIGELDAEWERRAEAWTPSTLVAASRRTLRRRALVIALGVAALLAIAGAAVASWAAERARARREASLRDRDIGRFALALAPFDWDPASRTARGVSAAELPALGWTLYEPATDDEDAPGEPVPARYLRRGASALEGDARVDHVEARGGHAFLVIDGRGRGGERCAPAVVPVRALPGYARREAAEPVLRIDVPTCAASAADLVEIPAGAFIAGGPGEPAATQPDVLPERVVELPAFAIDRTEVTNAAFGVFARMATMTGVRMPHYPTGPGVPGLDGPAFPVAGVTWREARAYCAFLGKRLPTTRQWTKALRGPATDNPYPRRNLPWGAPVAPVPAALSDTSQQPGTWPVDAWPGDRSPYGVIDLAGNVSEWARDRARDGIMGVIRGGNVAEVTAASLVEYMAVDNQRVSDERHFALGLRCVAE